MKPQDQEFFVEKNEVGDCVRACTASILELDIKDVPHFVKNEPGIAWYPTWEKFMENHGLKPIMYDGYPRFNGYSLASGVTHRDTKHMVVLWNGDIKHDPHYARTGLKETDTVWLLSSTS